MTQKFKKLTPKNDIDINQTYIDAIDFAIKDKEIYNVAISGNYGSGKSSFLETYKKEYGKSEEILHISLAKFEGMDGEDSEKELSNKDQKVLEGKIINQLLHQIDAKKIPLTIFKSKKNPGMGQIILWSIFVLILILSSLFLLNSNDIVKTFSNIIPISYKGNIEIVAMILLLVSIVFITYKIIWLQFYHKLFKNFSFKGVGISGDIEILKDSKESYFDRYLDDVLYLFNNSQKNIVVFEDIDRFNTNLIFEKLKEINTLVNRKRKSVENNEKIIFIYLIKDDMFTSKERTKFFDFIIPIIPVITSSNSKEKFTEILEELGCKEDLTSSFLQKISIYVDDMRLINNICNEFVFYKNNLIIEQNEKNVNEEDRKREKLDLSKERLFSMIVYKNIFPKDFSGLQKDKGFIYELFQQKENIKKTKIHSFEDEENRIRKEILELENEIFNNKKELFSSILTLPSNMVVLEVNNKFEYDFENRLDFISELIEDNSEIIAYSSFYDAYNKQKGIKTDKESIFPGYLNKQFQLRLESLKSKTILEDLNLDLNTIQKEKKSIQNSTLSKLISLDDINNIVCKEEYGYIKSHSQYSMLIFFIRNAYIDESYMEYITYFYSNSLTRIDKEFIMAVQADFSTEMDLKLINVGEVYDRLDIQDFDKSAVLNFSLFTYIITTENNQRKKDILIKYYVKPRLKFLVSMINSLSKSNQEETIKIVSNLMVYNSKLVIDLLESDLFTEDEKNEVILYLTFYIQLSILDDNESSVNESIENYISNYWNELWTNYLDMNNHLVLEIVTNNLKYLEVKIKDFDFSKDYIELSDEVYENNLYELNANNIESLFLYSSLPISVDEIRHKNFSTIMSNSEFFEILLDYVFDNIEDYIRSEIILSDGIIKNEFEDIYRILNCENLSNKTIKSYLECVEENSLDISEIINKDVQDLVISSNRAMFNSSNVLAYFDTYKVWNDTLVNFVNPKNIFNVDTKVFQNKEENFQETFFVETVKCSSLLNKHYRAILSKLGWYLNVLPEENLQEEKVSILIETGVISDGFEPEILIDVRSRYPKLVIDYILKFLDEYIIYIQSEESYDEQELLQVLDHEISIIQARKLVDIYKGVITIKNKKYNVHLLRYILSEKFDKSDLPYVLKNYSTYSKTIKNEIIKICQYEIDYILSQDKLSIDKQLLIDLCGEETIQLEKRRELLGQNISVLSKNEIVRVLDMVGLYQPYYQVIFEEIKEGKNPKIYVSDYNQNILNYLNRNQYFSSFRIDKKNPDNYMIYSFNKK